MPEDDFVWATKSEGHLITNRAGGSARAQADRLRSQQPVRTRLARLVGAHTDEQAHRLGAVGEETVGKRLARLDPHEWLVLNDIVLNEKGTNVDHLVIGPGGVFSLNTKHHPKAKIVVTERAFRVNGYRQNYLPVASHEAAKVGRLLQRACGFPVQVNAMIVVMGAELEIRSAPADVLVVRRRDLPKWFLRLRNKHPMDQIQALMRVAGRPSTWKADGVGAEFPNLSLKPWSRQGLKRLYVNDPKGKSLGYRDEVTGEIHTFDRADLARVRAALKEALAE